MRFKTKIAAFCLMGIFSIASYAGAIEERGLKFAYQEKWPEIDVKVIQISQDRVAVRIKNIDSKAIEIQGLKIYLPSASEVRGSYKHFQENYCAEPILGRKSEFPKVLTVASKSPSRSLFGAVSEYAFVLDCKSSFDIDSVSLKIDSNLGVRIYNISGEKETLDDLIKQGRQSFSPTKIN